jgi:hypothetical protein
MYQWRGVLLIIVSLPGMSIHAGAYDDEEAAARAYDLAALKYWGPDTILNFPVPPKFTPLSTPPHTVTLLLPRSPILCRLMRAFPAENFQFGHGRAVRLEYQSIPGKTYVVFVSADLGLV